jgi:hypothetical protein
MPTQRPRDREGEEQAAAPGVSHHNELLRDRLHEWRCDCLDSCAVCLAFATQPGHHPAGPLRGGIAQRLFRIFLSVRFIWSSGLTPPPPPRDGSSVFVSYYDPERVGDYPRDHSHTRESSFRGSVESRSSVSEAMRAKSSDIERGEMLLSLSSPAAAALLSLAVGATHQMRVLEDGEEEGDH